jgi:methionyl-tRNA formyltransferase
LDFYAEFYHDKGENSFVFRVIFMGTPEFAVPSLQALVENGQDIVRVVGVITQPDRPAGRGQKLQISPVKALAQKFDLPVYQPEKLRGPESIAQLQKWQPDVYVVVAYGQILRQSILSIPPKGSVNVHGSLLPRWRGASPIQAVIRAGDTETGVTIMLMDEGMDTGPMLYKSVIPLASDETAQSLHDKLAAISGEALLKGLLGYLKGELQPQPQDDSLATYTNLLKKEDGEIDWRESAIQIDRTVRAFTPWPGTYTYWQGQLLKIKSGYPLSKLSLPLAPGQVALRVEDALMVIGTGQGCYAPQELQLEGRKALKVTDFVNGMSDIDGIVLGT